MHKGPRKRGPFFDLPLAGEAPAVQSGWLRTIHNIPTPTTKAVKAIIISNSWCTIIALLLLNPRRMNNNRKLTNC